MDEGVMVQECSSLERALAVSRRMLSSSVKVFGRVEASEELVLLAYKSLKW